MFITWGCNDYYSLSIPKSAQSKGPKFNFLAGDYPARKKDSTFFFNGTNPTSMEIADFNADGRMDFVTTDNGGQKVFIYTNHGQKTFSFSTVALTNYPNDLAIGDIDGDGDKDIVVFGQTFAGSTEVSTLINNGSGVFTVKDVLTAPDGANDTVGLYDIDNDGDLDLLHSTYNTIEIRRNDGLGNFSAATSLPKVANPNMNFRTPNQLAFGDIDQDGDIDMASLDSDDQKLWFFINDGSGNFTESPDKINAPWPDTVALEDLNNDGYPELILQTGDLYIYINNAGVFTTPSSSLDTSASYSYSQRFFDVDQDGDKDIVYPFSGMGTFYVAHNNGTGGFGTPISYDSGWNSYDVIPFDLNQDGHLDFISIHHSDSSVVIYWGDNKTPFPEIVMPGGSTGISVTHGDFNKDGRMDFAYGIAGGFVVKTNQGNNVFGADEIYSTPGSGSYRILAADLDKDTHLDISMIDTNNSLLYYAFNNGDGTFATPLNFSISASAINQVVDDFNKDGFPDIVVLHQPGEVVYYQNNTDKTFAAGVTIASGLLTMGIESLDYNNDGNLDIVYSDYSNAQLIKIAGDGAGNFSVDGGIPTCTQPASIWKGDVNNDGRLDLVTNCIVAGNIHILLNSNGGNFTLHQDIFSQSFAMFADVTDLNGDDYPDLIASETAGSVSIRLNNKDGTFGASRYYKTKPNTYGMTVADFNNDEVKDFIVLNLMDSTMMYFPWTKNP